MQSYTEPKQNRKFSGKYHRRIQATTSKRRHCAWSLEPLPKMGKTSAQKINFRGEIPGLKPGDNIFPAFYKGKFNFIKSSTKNERQKNPSAHSIGGIVLLLSMPLFFYSRKNHSCILVFFLKPISHFPKNMQTLCLKKIIRIQQNL